MKTCVQCKKRYINSWMRELVGQPENYKCLWCSREWLQSFLYFLKYWTYKVSSDSGIENNERIRKETVESLKIVNNRINENPNLKLREESVLLIEYDPPIGTIRSIT